MKPIVIAMQAFGPFAHRQVIDFRELGSKTFFLIHGPTGSGKTTILDGICFALFGDSSGGEREGKQMRSHHADAKLLTEVSFDFALGQERYRVKRVPEQDRPAKRGGRETTQAQIAELSRLTTEGGREVEVPVESGWKKVGERVETLLGFKSEQFRQVIMLPQGKFFEFLKANSQKREEILQALFGTALYKRIEESLKESAHRVKVDAEKVSTQRRALLDQAKADDEAALALRLQQQIEEIESRQRTDLACMTAAQQADKSLVDARQVAGLFDEHDQAVTALQGLQAQQPAWQGKRSQHGAAQRASSVRPYDDQLVGLGQQLADELARAKLLVAQAALAASASKSADAALATEKARAPELEAAIARLSELDALVAKVSELAATRAAHAQATAESLRLATAMAVSKQALQQAAALVQKTTADLQGRRVQAAGLPGLRAKLEGLNKQLDQAGTLADCGAQLQAARLRVDSQTQTATKAEAKSLDLRQRLVATRVSWIVGQAARLAHELTDGQACPVCGAIDHPSPAHADDAPVPDEALQTAEDLLTQAEAAQRKVELALGQEKLAVAGLEARITEIQASLGAALPDPVQLKLQAQVAGTDLAQAEAAVKGVAQLEPELASAEAGLKAAEQQAGTAELAAQQAAALLHQSEGQLREREAGVPANLADPKLLQTARQAVERSRDALKKALDGAAQAASAAGNKLAETQAHAQASSQAGAKLQEQHRQKALDLDQRIAAAGFADLATYRAASLAEAAITTLASDIQAFDQSLAASVQRQTRAQAGTENRLRPDLAAVQLANEAAKVAQIAASNAVRDALAARNETAGFDASLRELAERFKSLESRYGLLKQVADLASGANSHRMSFQRYVLATLLEEVLAATTLRLRVMSRSRYEVRRKVQTGDQRSAAGLDLEILDHYTGMGRSVSTLSGGESFLASLALALGLSDVVQSYSGGIRLDAIFVDEGFGTLDPESLDFAISALKDLQQAGRMVGIISHVAELKEWIDARLELKMTPNGSVAEFTR